MEKLIIVGAGAAGLMAARELAPSYSVTILEAAPRPGGRIHSIPTLFASRPVEAGAEFIHGHCKLTLKLLKEAGIPYEEADGKMYRHKKDYWEEQTEMIEGWRVLLRQMKKTEEDYSLHDFLQIHFSEPEFSSLRVQAIRYAEGFDLADVKKVSIQSLYKEWSNEEERFFRIPDGYGALVKHLYHECSEQGVELLTNKVVEYIKWKENDVTLFTQDGQQYWGNKCIITVPVHNWLRPQEKGYIEFSPTIDRYMKAAKWIGYGCVIKVVLRFRERFWKEKIGFVISDEIFPVWWTQDPDRGLLLTGWMGGPKAEDWGHNSDDELLHAALSSLATIFEMKKSELETLLTEKYVFNWGKTQFIGGGYSYDTLESEQGREVLCTPVVNTIYFAGEAIYDGKSPGTVEAALASGRDVAKKLK